jgi:hypothetical protein
MVKYNSKFMSLVIWTVSNLGSPYKLIEVLKLNELSKAKVDLHRAGWWHLTSGVPEGLLHHGSP